jgi:hypothetical protein
MVASGNVGLNIAAGGWQPMKQLPGVAVGFSRVQRLLMVASK